MPAPAAYYTSLPAAGLVIYILRTRCGYRSLPEVGTVAGAARPGAAELDVRAPAVKGCSPASLV